MAIKGEAEDRHLQALRRYWRENHQFPSIAKLCTVLGLASKNSVSVAMKRLEAAGYLTQSDGRYAPSAKFFGRAIYGSVRAGFPEQGSFGFDKDILIDEFLMRRPETSVLLRIKGDSMSEAGLIEGDIAVVEKVAKAKPGDIVVATIDGEETVKYLRRAVKGAWYLEPANPAYPDIHPSGKMELLGVIVSSFRQYRNR